LMLFINRSHIDNLFHPLVPFCIIATVNAAELHRRLAPLARRHVPLGARTVACFGAKLIPAAAICVTLAALIMNPMVRAYPNLVARWTGAPPWRTASSDDQFLFSSRHDAPLSYATYSQELDEFHAITDVLQQLKRHGRSVAIIGASDTRFLVEADLPPYFRYSPVLKLVRMSELAADRQMIHLHPVDFVLLLPDPTYQDAQDQFKGVLAENYLLDRELHGGLLYRSKNVQAIE